MMAEIYIWKYVYFVWPLEYQIKKFTVPTKRGTLSLFKVESCNVLLHMLLVYISSLLKSVLRYKFVILFTYHLGTVYLVEEGCGDPWLFFETKKWPASKQVWEALVYCIVLLQQARN
jgi:hypothetical protein